MNWLCEVEQIPWPILTSFFPQIFIWAPTVCQALEVEEPTRQRSCPQGTHILGEMHDKQISKHKIKTWKQQGGLWRQHRELFWIGFYFGEGSHLGRVKWKKCLGEESSRWRGQHAGRAIGRGAPGVFMEQGEGQIPYSGWSRVIEGKEGTGRR